MFSNPMSEPIKHGGELDEGQEGGGELVVAGGDPTVFFDATEEVFDVLAIPVVVAMEPGRTEATLSGWNATAGMLGAQTVPEPISVEPFISYDPMVRHTPQPRRAGRVGGREPA